MAGQPNAGAGNNEQRRAKAREAREEGKLASEVGASTGANKQTKKAPNNASHQEKMDLSSGEAKGKRSPGTSGKPRPGNREVDPERTDDWV
jgi:hypothetical protein